MSKGEFGEKKGTGQIYECLSKVKRGKLYQEEPQRGKQQPPEGLFKRVWSSEKRKHVNKPIRRDVGTKKI